MFDFPHGDGERPDKPDCPKDDPADGEPAQQDAPVDPAEAPDRATGA